MILNISSASVFSSEIHILQFPKENLFIEDMHSSIQPPCICKIKLRELEWVPYYEIS